MKLLSILLPSLVLILCCSWFIIGATQQMYHRIRFQREYRKLVLRFQLGELPEPGTIAKGEVKR